MKTFPIRILFTYCLIECVLGAATAGPTAPSGEPAGAGEPPGEPRGVPPPSLATTGARGRYSESLSWCNTTIRPRAPGIRRRYTTSDTLSMIAPGQFRAVHPHPVPGCERSSPAASVIAPFLRCTTWRLLRWPPEPSCPPHPDWSATVSAPTVMAAPAMSTLAPQRVSWSRPMMHESRMTASQNSCITSWSATRTASRFLPLIPVSCPVTVVRRMLVAVHPHESAPVVPGKTPGRAREMVYSVSTKAVQGRPSILQRR
ncbi:unnamed protein product [Boreogadus saida]